MNVETTPAATGLVLAGLLFLALVTAGSFQHISPDGYFASAPDREPVTEFEVDGIQIQTSYPGARLSRFTQVDDSLYHALVLPENAPINNSPWYSFRIWADEERTITLELLYEEGTHRYRPKLSRDGENWTEIEADRIRHHPGSGSATIELEVGPSPLYVSAQELWTPDDYNRWADRVAGHRFVRRDTVGRSVEDRPIEKLTLDETTDSDAGVVILLARQHPPEVTGDMAFRAFMDELLGSDTLAREFRRQFRVIAYPLVNPDGVANGNWRHNADGVDLNRDWNHFHQPETRAIRDDLLTLKENGERVYFGIDFHSTKENKFFPIKRHIETFPDNFSYGWMEAIREAHPSANIAVDPFDTREKIAKNWLWRTFGSDGITYEVADTADRQTLREVARTSARTLMQQLLEKRADS